MIKGVICQVDLDGDFDILDMVQESRLLVPNDIKQQIILRNDVSFACNLESLIPHVEIISQHELETVCGFAFIIRENAIDGMRQLIRVFQCAYDVNLSNYYAIFQRENDVKYVAFNQFIPFMPYTYQISANHETCFYYEIRSNLTSILQIVASHDSATNDNLMQVVYCRDLTLNAYIASFDSEEQQDSTQAQLRYRTPDRPNAFESDACPICLTELTQPHQLACGHITCFQCITQWAMSDPSCPICRSSI